MTTEDQDTPITRKDILYGFGTIEAETIVRPHFAVRLTDLPWYLRLWNWLVRA